MSIRRFFILLLPFGLAACAQQGPTPYAERYVAALERYPGVVQTSTAPIEAFVTFFSTHDPNAAPSADALYAPALYFSDTLLTSERRDEVIVHLERMRSGTGELKVTVLDSQVDGADVYVVWRMHARFQPVRRTVESDTIGVTHLRFDGEGRIVLQQDFWDSTEGFYRHLPGVGSIVAAIGKRFTPDE